MKAAIMNTQHITTDMMIHQLTRPQVESVIQANCRFALYPVTEVRNLTVLCYL